MFQRKRPGPPPDACQAGRLPAAHTLRGVVEPDVRASARMPLLQQAVSSSATAAPVLWADDLAGQRGERTLFEHLGIALPPGSVTWLRGRNGRGKTTLLRLLAGLASPMTGSIAVMGIPHRRTDLAWRHALLYIGHQNSLKDDLSAAEALAFLMRVAGVPTTMAQVEAALHRLGVHAKRRALVRTLSQGQRRRVALARLALSLERPLWLLDEPFDALDADGVATLNALLAEHAARGGATLLTSHQALSLEQPQPQVLDLDRHESA
jgi:heme exporter protein A